MLTYSDVCSDVCSDVRRYLHSEQVGEKVTCHDGACLCLFYHRTALRQPPVLLSLSLSPNVHICISMLIVYLYMQVLVQERLHSGHASSREYINANSILIPAGTAASAPP